MSKPLLLCARGTPQSLISNMQCDIGNCGVSWDICCCILLETVHILAVCSSESDMNSTLVISQKSLLHLNVIWLWSILGAFRLFHSHTTNWNLTVSLYHQSIFHIYRGCFKKSFTTLKAYRNLYRGHTQRFELSKCSKTHRVLPRIVMVQCDFHW
jgi:hypothetical protein